MKMRINWNILPHCLRTKIDSRCFTALSMIKKAIRPEGTTFRDEKTAECNKVLSDLRAYKYNRIKYMYILHACNAVRIS